MATDELGAAIRAAREHKSLSTQAAAEAAAISPAYLNKLETGRVGAPSPHVLQRVATALDVPYWTLMDLAGYVPGEPPQTRPHRPIQRETATNERLLELLLEIKGAVAALQDSSQPG